MLETHNQYRTVEEARGSGRVPKSVDPQFPHAQQAFAPLNLTTLAILLLTTSVEEGYFQKQIMTTRLQLSALGMCHSTMI